VTAVSAAFEALPAFAALDGEVREFLAGLVVDDPKEEDSAFEESLGEWYRDMLEQLVTESRGCGTGGVVA
jgi:hypothetical protein